MKKIEKLSGLENKSLTPDVPVEEKPVEKQQDPLPTETIIPGKPYPENFPINEFTNLFAKCLQINYSNPSKDITITKKDINNDNCQQIEVAFSSGETMLLTEFREGETMFKLTSGSNTLEFKTHQTPLFLVANGSKLESFDIANHTPKDWTRFGEVTKQYASGRGHAGLIAIENFGRNLRDICNLNPETLEQTIYAADPKMFSKAEDSGIVIFERNDRCQARSATITPTKEGFDVSFCIHDGSNELIAKADKAGVINKITWQSKNREVFAEQNIECGSLEVMFGKTALITDWKSLSDFAPKMAIPSSGTTALRESKAVELDF